MTEQTDDHDKLIEMKATMDDLKRSQDAFNCAMFGVNGKPGVQATLAKLCEIVERNENSAKDIKQVESRALDERLKRLEDASERHGTRLGELEAYMSRQKGKGIGKSELLTMVSAVIAALGTLVTIVIALGGLAND